jgi:copper(I)-binding protein
MIRTLALAAAVAAIPALAAAAIVVEQPEVRASIGAQKTSAAYMSLRNTGPAADRLLGARCDCAASVSIHQTRTVGGVASMAPEGAVTVAPGAVVRFAPGGRHLMLTGVKAPIAAGQKPVIELRFEKAGVLRVPFVATDAPGMGAMPGMDHHHGP